MATDRPTQSVRRQPAVGRLLPLGEAADGAWLVERAAVGVLRQALNRLPGVRPGAMRVALADFAAAGEPAVPPPPGALPPGPVRIDAEFDAALDEPLPTAAERVRATLAEAADSRLGLVVTAIDLRIGGLLEESEDASARAGAPKDPRGPGEDPRNGEAPRDGDFGGTVNDPGAGTGAGVEAAVRDAALTVPGAVRLASLPGDGFRPVRVGPMPPEGGGDVPSGRHAHIQLAVSADHRVLDVVRRVRAVVEPVAANGTLGPVAVTILVTEVVDAEGHRGGDR